MPRVTMIAACILMGVAGAAAGRLAAPRAGLRGHYYTNLTRSGAPIAVTIVRYARGPFLNRPRSADEPVRPLVVAYIRHAKIPMAVVVALALFGLIAYVAGRPPQLMAGVFLGLVVAYFTFLPAFGQSPQDRYRLPVDALLFMLAVLGLTRLVRQLPSPRLRSAGGTASASAKAPARQAKLAV